MAQRPRCVKHLLKQVNFALEKRLGMSYRDHACEEKVR